MRDELNERFTLCLSFATKMAVFLPLPSKNLGYFLLSFPINLSLTLPLSVPPFFSYLIKLEGCILTGEEIV